MVLGEPSQAQTPLTPTEVWQSALAALSEAEESMKPAESVLYPFWKLMFFGVTLKNMRFKSAAFADSP